MTRFSAHLEITGGIIRLYSAGSYEQGSPFDFDVPFVGDDGRAILKALNSEAGLARGHIRAIGDCLKQCGFTRVEWDRCRRVDGRLNIRRMAVVIR